MLSLITQLEMQARWDNCPKHEANLYVFDSTKEGGSKS